MALLGGASHGGADELPPPPGWTQEMWDRLSPDDQQIERENSPATVDDADAEIAAEQAWADSHSEEDLDAELLALWPDEDLGIEPTPMLGIGPPPERYNGDLYSLASSWTGLSDDGERMLEVDVGSPATDDNVGLVVVRVSSWAGEDSEGPLPLLSEDVYTYPGGWLDIESSEGDVLTLCQWIGSTRQPGRILFDVGRRTFGTASGSAAG